MVNPGRDVNAFPRAGIFDAFITPESPLRDVNFISRSKALEYRRMCFRYFTDAFPVDLPMHAVNDSSSLFSRKKLTCWNG